MVTFVEEEEIPEERHQEEQYNEQDQQQRASFSASSSVSLVAPLLLPPPPQPPLPLPNQYQGKQWTLQQQPHQTTKTAIKTNPLLPTIQSIPSTIWWSVCCQRVQSGRRWWQMAFEQRTLTRFSVWAAAAAAAAAAAVVTITVVVTLRCHLEACHPRPERTLSRRPHPEDKKKKEEEMAKVVVKVLLRLDSHRRRLEDNNNTTKMLAVKMEVAAGVVMYPTVTSQPSLLVTC
jgi:hypothetical protein